MKKSKNKYKCIVCDAGYDMLEPPEECYICGSPVEPIWQEEEKEIISTTH